MRIRSEVQRLPVDAMTGAIDHIMESHGTEFSTIWDQFPQMPTVLDHIRERMLQQGSSLEAAQQAVLGAALGISAIVGPAIFKEI